MEPMIPRTRKETLLAAINGQDVEQLIPVTDEETFLAKIGGQDVELPVPKTRVDEFLQAIIDGGGGGGDITLTTLNVSANGTTNAPSGTAYNKVVASVSNTYEASDEGKVVSNGALVSQTSDTATSNGTVDTTLINSLTVAVDLLAKARTLVNHTATEYIDDAVTVIGEYSLSMSSLTTIKCHNVTKIGNSGLAGCGCTALAFPNLTTLGVTTIRQSTHLVACDFGASLPSMPNQTLNGCTALTVLVLRKTSAPCGMGASNVLGSTPFSSGGSGGTIYIPKVLYDHLGDGTSLDYKASTNWSIYDGYGTITWAKIEGSIYETQYADGTPIPTT